MGCFFEKYVRLLKNGSYLIRGVYPNFLRTSVNRQCIAGEEIECTKERLRSTSQNEAHIMLMLQQGVAEWHEFTQNREKCR